MGYSMVGTYMEEFGRRKGRGKTYYIIIPEIKKKKCVNHRPFGFLAHALLAHQRTQ